MNAEMPIEQKADGRPAPEDPTAGARTLLAGCVGARPGEQVLFVREDGRHGYYDEAAGERARMETRAAARRA
jgi:hypothetical protein